MAGSQCAGVELATITPRVGDRVRCYFGPRCWRTGTVEGFSREHGLPLVRLSPGWLHTAELHDLVPAAEGRGESDWQGLAPVGA